MMLKIRFRFVLIILLLGAMGYTIYYFVQRQKFMNLIVPEFSKITLIKANLHSDTAFIEVDGIVINKAPYGMSIDSIVCELSLDGTQLVSTSQYVGLRLESGQSDSVQFSVNIPISHTRNKIQSLQGQDSTGVVLEAAIVYSGFKLPFVKSKKIEVPVPPQFKLIKTEKKELNLFKKELEVDLFLGIINDGKNLSLDIHDLQYELSIGNDLTTKGKFGKDISLRPQTSQVLKFPLDIKMKQPLKTIFKVLKDEDRLPFRLMISGYLDVGKMQRIPTVIFASGKLEIVNEQKKKAKKKAKREKKKEERQDRREGRKEARQEKREDRKKE
ncbi:hypothetical protein [Fluviicola taffensis]|uniref:Late embryogenesis abundant protein 2 n=1 Tax=Fluviicola taffensis (strain DSM 16823 / NCIMB 13979 / RW262) TaxID=755732 RepID=F2IIH2_FLUTR|nr:hypothetical protein [Fluviicola taffensis]AEA44898.1 hypothetical protein Fluta_2919 [Fluviicola taffensis DSM 16823]